VLSFVFNRKCPNCGTRNVRHATTRGVKEQHWLRSVYSCRECKQSFWLIRKVPYVAFASFGVAVAFAALAWALTSLISRINDDRQVTSAAEELKSMATRAHAADATAEYELARRYREGVGVRLDDVQARMWLERAAEHGHSQAQLELGLASLRGNGVLQDFQTAYRWLSMAAEGGNTQAQYNLGLLYRNGTGVPPDNVKAYIWLNLAAAQGIEPAVAARDTTMRLLSPQEIVQAQAEARRLSSAQPAAASLRPRAPISSSPP
jgi:hypothetical protein